MFSSEHEKQAAHGWGGQTGGEEWADEKAGETIAKDEEKAEGFVPEADEAAPAGEEGFKPEATGSLLRTRDIAPGSNTMRRAGLPGSMQYLAK